MAQPFLLRRLVAGFHCFVSDDCALLVLCQSEHTRFWLADTTSGFPERYADVTVDGLCWPDRFIGLPDEFYPLYVYSVGRSHSFHFAAAQTRPKAAA